MGDESIVVVTWVDSSIVELGGWTDRLSALEHAGRLAVRSVGFVVARTEEALLLSQSLDDDYGRMQGCLAIPARAVLTETPLAMEV